MIYRKWMRLLLVGALALALAPCRASAQSDLPALQSRLDALQKLIESSSGARQVESSREPEALALREQARALYAEALRGRETGDAEAVGRLLDAAAARMFEAIRAASPKELADIKRSADYDKRLKSVEALLATQQRIGDEKGLPEEAARVATIVRGYMERAEVLRREQQYDGAQVMLDQAYNAIKLSLESMRSGETLVRSLDFRSKEEEFYYELDRNNTHLMLIKVLLESNRGDDVKLKMVDSFLKSASELRQRAEQLAEKRRFDEAIDLLEDSTLQLVRAIRGAGVYIPG